MHNGQGLCAASPRRRVRPFGCAVALCAVALLGPVGCSLVSFKSPEKPLPPRDLNARILTRELAAQFRVAAERCAADIAASEQDPQVLDNTLRWEIAAIAESRRASTQMAPMLSLLDTWALALQMKAFVGPGGAGGALFGRHQEAVREVSDNFADGADALARALSKPDEYSEYQKFVASYADAHPFKDLNFERASVVVAWSHEKGSDTRLLDTLGTVPQALTDSAQRMQIYGETLPPEVMRETELTLREAGYSKGDVQSSLRQLDERLARLGEVAQSAPEVVRGAVADVRESVREVLDRLDASSRATAAELGTQRAALFEDIRSERAAIVAAVDTQRQALAADAAKVAELVVKRSGEQARLLAGEAVALLLVLIVVLLGLPFAAGYFVGRARHGRARHEPP
jgi:hypothetical protein